MKLTSIDRREEEKTSNRFLCRLTYLYPFQSSCLLRCNRKTTDTSLPVHRQHDPHSFQIYQQTGRPGVDGRKRKERLVLLIDSVQAEQGEMLVKCAKVSTHFRFSPSSHQNLPLVIKERIESFFEQFNRNMRKYRRIQALIRREKVAGSALLGVH